MRFLLSKARRLAEPLLGIFCTALADSAFGIEGVGLPHALPLPPLADVRLALGLQKYLADQLVLLEGHLRPLAIAM